MKIKPRNNTLPNCVVCDRNGTIIEIPDLYMTGMSLNNYVLPTSRMLIEMPFGSDLFTLPGRAAVGYDPVKRASVEICQYLGEPVFPVAAFMAPAYVQVLRSAYTALPGAVRLPLYSYTAVGWKKGRFYVPAVRIDPDCRQDLQNFDCAIIEKNARRIQKQYPKNRLIQHLVLNCVLRYGCPAARNFVMGRWECPVPASPACNAACIGCISEQPSATRVTASHERIAFVPTVEEIVELAVPHLEHAERAVISFGQGCEGEPLMVGNIIEAAIQEIRKRTAKGIINMNTNASLPGMLERLFKAGLDSIRVSMNSAQKVFYEAYYRPRTYTFAAVSESLKIARKYNRWSSINYFVFPGFTDHPAEIVALRKLIDKSKINMIQARNLNIDPHWYIESLGLNKLRNKPIGIGSWIRRIRKDFPWIKFGYFNPPREEMKKKHFAF